METGNYDMGIFSRAKASSGRLWSYEDGRIEPMNHMFIDEKHRGRISNWGCEDLETDTLSRPSYQISGNLDVEVEMMGSETI